VSSKKCQVSMRTTKENQESRLALRRRNRSPPKQNKSEEGKEGVGESCTKKNPMINPEKRGKEVSDCGDRESSFGASCRVLFRVGRRWVGDSKNAMGGRRVRDQENGGGRNKL